MKKHIELLKEALLISDLVIKEQKLFQHGEDLRTDSYDEEAEKIGKQIKNIENRIKKYLNKRIDCITVDGVEDCICGSNYLIPQDNNGYVYDKDTVCSTIRFRIICHECELATDWFDNVLKAKKAWNILIMEKLHRGG